MHFKKDRKNKRNDAFDKKNMISNEQSVHFWHAFFVFFFVVVVDKTCLMILCAKMSFYDTLDVDMKFKKEDEIVHKYGI